MIDRETGKVDCGGVRNEGGQTVTAGARVGFLLGVKKAMVLGLCKGGQTKRPDKQKPIRTVKAKPVMVNCFAGCSYFYYQFFFLSPNIILTILDLFMDDEAFS